MKKAELQHRVHELEMELLEAKHRSQSKQVIEKQTFIPETRKIKTFCGRPKNSATTFLEISLSYSQTTTL